MRHLARSIVAPFAVFMVLTSGCSSITDNVSPDAIDGGKSLGNAQCTPELLNSPNGAQRFIVDWNDGDRSSLEDEMHDGVVLIKYTCDGMEVLRSCSQPGAYDYRASNSQKSRTLQIADAITASANFSSPTPGAALQAMFEQDRALNLAYVMVGSKTTPVKDIVRSSIERANCQEATHFVYQTQLGAFMMAAGEKGQAATAAQVFGFGDADASASSSRDVLSSDGNAEACVNANHDDIEPPQGCGALMRVSILPISNN